MRDRDSGVSARGDALGATPERGDGTKRQEVPYDERTFFESFYKSSTETNVTDRMTIGSDISLLEARFHYNVVENSIIRALAHREPPPRGAAALAWELLLQRRGLRLLDLGSGAGHWIDFFRDVLLITEAVGVEITERMTEFLRTKYAGNANVRILEMDIAAPQFSVSAIGGPVNYITAIGIMFHIVDDSRWLLCLKKLAGMLKPEGLMFVGGDFGAETKNVQYNKTDEFASWTEYRKIEAPETEVRVNKRVRSLAAWQEAANQAGLSIVDLVRSDADDVIRTPENDLLVLQPTAPTLA